MKDFKMQVFPPASLPKTLAARQDKLDELLRGVEVVDDEGRPTGEWAPLISKTLYRKLLESFKELP